MVSKILVTGAAGYIGGSIIAHFVSNGIESIEKSQIVAAVRTQEQANSLSVFGVSVILLDLSSSKDVTEAVQKHNITLVINTSKSIDDDIALPLIDALSQHGKLSEQKTAFIHTSGLGGFTPGSGWPNGPFKDTDSVFEIEKSLADSFPIRKTDVSVTEYAEEKGVKSFIVVPPLVYGKGTGTWNQLSVVLPVYVKAAIAEREVHKLDGETRISAVHISDIAILYGLLVDKIRADKPIPNGREGFYFGISHKISTTETTNALASALKARGLVDDQKVQIYQNDDEAARSLGVPTPFVQPIFNSGDNFTAERSYQIGWKPVWDKTAFLEKIDLEVQAVLDLGKAKSTLIDSLFELSKN